MLNWAGLLDRKYKLMEQEAATRGMGIAADANLANVRAGLLPAESAANIGLTGAQAQFARANAGLATSRARATDEETKYIGDIARAGIGETNARSRLYGAQAVGEDQLNRFNVGTFKGLGWLRDNRDRIDSLTRSMTRFGLIGDE